MSEQTGYVRREIEILIEKQTEMIKNAATEMKVDIDGLISRWHVCEKNLCGEGYVNRNFQNQMAKRYKRQK